MSHRRRAGALVGLLVASVLAGAFVVPASASQTQASADTDAEAATVAAGESLQSLQSAENETLPRANTTIDHDGDQVTLTASAGETIDGETDVAPGTTLSLQVQSEDAQSPFFVTNETTVADDGSFNGTVDLSKVPADTPIAVQVRNESATLARASGEVVRCTENCTGPEQWPQFDPGIITAPQGEDVEVTVAVPDAVEGPVNVTLGDEESGFLVETTVIDANDDGEIALTLNTSTAGNGSPSEYLSAGEDGIVTATQRSEEITPPLEDGFYDLAVGPSDAPYDVGTLNIDDPDREEVGEDDASGSDDPGEIDVDTTGEVTFITAGDTLEVGNVENQRITAETELEPGSTVNVRIASREASEPFLFTPSATVTDYGTFNVTADLSDVSPDTSLKVVAEHDGEAVGAAAGRVVNCADGCPQVANGANQSASASGSNAANEAADNESNVVEVDDEGSIPVEALGAIGVGGLLAVLGVVRFSGVIS